MSTVPRKSSPLAQATHPPVDVEAQEVDSAAEDEASILADLRTLRSSIFDYEYENGRRYHAYRAGGYLLPNDEMEQDRLDLTHHIWTLVLDGALCKAKLRNPKRILDIGTGTGIWACDMGDAYPEARIIGTDLSPIQITDVPSNVYFEIDDAREPWVWPENYFDFIHVRTLAGAIQNWPRFLEQCYRHLKPGGKLEISEGRANFWYAHDSVPDTSATWKWLKEWRRLGPKVQFDIFEVLRGQVEQLPFTVVDYDEQLVPLGPWLRDPKRKEIGKCFLISALERNALDAYTLALFTRAGGWKAAEIQVLMSQVKGELLSMKMHLYTFCSFLVAEKPRSTARV